MTACFFQVQIKPS